jgi:hypothetical protein
MEVISFRAGWLGIDIGFLRHLIIYVWSSLEKLFSSLLKIRAMESRLVRLHRRNVHRRRASLRRACRADASRSKMRSPTTIVDINTRSALRTRSTASARTSRPRSMRRGRPATTGVRISKALFQRKEEYKMDV